MCFVWLNDGDCWQIFSYDLVFICGLHITIRCWILKICLVLIVEGWERGRCKTNTTHLSSIQRLLRGQAQMMLPISRCYCDNYWGVWGFWFYFKCTNALLSLPSRLIHKTSTILLSLVLEEILNLCEEDKVK